MKLKYVANQLTPDGLDEIQRVLLAYKLGHHSALSGPPGVGKTDLVLQIPKIVGRPLFEITCDSYMTEAPLIGYPELSGQNGSTVTVWINGVATNAAQENGILYEDEFDQLPGSVQKRQNSLFDDRRYITRRDGKVIPAGDNFFCLISYNPSDKLSKRELEEAVADRFVHLSFEYLPPKLEAALATGNTDSLGLEERAILLSADSMRFMYKSGNAWKDFFTNEKVTHTDRSVEYGALKRPDKAQNVPPRKLSKAELADRTADFFVSVRSFAEQGTNKLPDEIKQYLKEIGEVTTVPLHKPSTRIIKAALAQYDVLTGIGMKPELAQAYAAQLCADQICYGKFGLRPLGKGTVYDAVIAMAQFYGLIGKPKQRTDFTR